MSGRHNKRRRGNGKKHIHKPTFLARLQQSRKDRGLAPTYTGDPIMDRLSKKVEEISSLAKITPADSVPIEKKGFLRKFFNRRTGG